MTPNELKAVIEAFDDVMNTALVRAAEWGCYVSRPETANLFVDGDSLIIRTWMPSDDGYGAPLLEEGSARVPLSFVLADGAERAAMVEEKKQRQRVESEAFYAALEAEREAEERRAYEALKAKFGG